MAPSLKGSRIFNHLRQPSEIDDAHILRMCLAIRQKDAQMAQNKSTMSTKKHFKEHVDNSMYSMAQFGGQSNNKRVRPQTAKHRVNGG